MTKIIAQHNGIKLVEKEDGTQMYYSTKTGKTAVGTKMLARLLSCHHQTISNLVGKLDCFDNAQLPTTQGVRMVNFITEDHIPDVLEYISNSRMKKQTKVNAAKFGKKLQQAGFRLMVLLEVAPEIVAKEAINNIDSPEVADQVAQDASLHGQYLRSHISINYEAEMNNLKAGKIVGENNVAIGLPYSGGRKKADNNQKATLTVTQLDQSSVLNKARKSEKEISEENKYDLCDKVRQIYAENRKAVNAILESL